ncbi:WW domain binding protein 1-like [Bagarius yarrelli]|uniref:WW domain binding protein 1-like n=1 Tax=Bagarius yarrelli TaxID=175774 RepID=A0A556TMY5_BAGYA|nr:WW domain binding protein 1-like [Bagarius yarrelli]
MWERGCTPLKMGLFIMNAVVEAASSATAKEAEITESKLLCNGVNNQTYICESGHCCGESQCCSYYYELWWFWLVWTFIIILSCCCVCHHRRTKHRLQQQQRQHEINLIAYREVHNYTSLPFYFRFLPSYLLPAYEEVENRPPTPPPPYSPSQPGQSTDSVSSEQNHELCPSLQTGSTATASESNSTVHCIEEASHSPAHRPMGDEHKPYLSFEEDRQQQQQVASATSTEISKNFKELGDQGLESFLESKDKTVGRHRRFTGDSGIEVCICSRGPGDGEYEEEEEMKELEGLLDREELQKQDFCDSCNSHNDSLHEPGDEEQGFAGPERNPEHRETPVQRLPISLQLHTINEQEAPQQSNSTDPQV